MVTPKPSTPSECNATILQLWGHQEVQVRPGDGYVALRLPMPHLRRILTDHHYQDHLRAFSAGARPVFDLRDGRLWMPFRLAFHVAMQHDARFAVQVSEVIGHIVTETPPDDLPPAMRVIRALIDGNRVSLDDASG